MRHARGPVEAAGVMPRRWRIKPRGRPDVRRYRRYMEQEFENVVLYRRLAQDAEHEHREVLLELAVAEEWHARYWRQKLTNSG